MALKKQTAPEVADYYGHKSESPCNCVAPDLAPKETAESQEARGEAREKGEKLPDPVTVLRCRRCGAFV